MESIYEIRKQAILDTAENEKRLAGRNRGRALHDLACAICSVPDLAGRTKEYISLVESCGENGIPVPEQHNRVVHTNCTVYTDGRPVQKLGIPVVSYSYGDSTVTFHPESVTVELNLSGRRRSHYSADIPYLAAENDDIELEENTEIISRMTTDILDAVSQFRCTEREFYTWLDGRTGVQQEADMDLER
jgi:hypothetical protein